MDSQGAAMQSATSAKVESNLVAESGRPEKDFDNISKQDKTLAQDMIQGYTKVPGFDKGADQKEAPEHLEPVGEVNMEAPIDPDDVIRAGGFGARDDISSFLPVASDSTDFESSLLDMRDYEEPQAAQHRPGLGWSEYKQPK